MVYHTSYCSTIIIDNQQVFNLWHGLCIYDIMRIDPSLSYPVLQFRSKSVIAYNEYVFERSGQHRASLSRHLKEVREKAPAYSGVMTFGAKKRLTKAVSLLVQSSKMREIKNPVTGKYQSFKLSFITLTIPECNIKPDAKFCNKHLLEPFLRTMRRKYGLKNYVWKLELQKNGMVHYHITSNMFILHSDIKSEWNNILRRSDLLLDYKARTGKDDPNSTDIKSVKNVKNLEAYLVKYVTKDTQNSEGVKTKIWDCSLSLKKQNYFTTHSTWDYQQRLRDLEAKGTVKSYAGDRYVIFKFKSNPVFEILNETEKRKYFIHINNIRNGKDQSITTTMSDLQPKELGNIGQPTSEIKAAIQYRLFGNDVAPRSAREGLPEEPKRIPFGGHQAFCN